jgi:hypothetical protein
MRELLVILPTINTFIRFENEGLIQLLKEEAKRGVKTRMLIQVHMQQKMITPIKIISNQMRKQTYRNCSRTL